MGNEYYGAPTTPTSDYLAHYGVKGMKWGVRKAISKGGKALAKQYRKDAKHLAKLEKRAVSGKKYAKRAAALGAGAAAAGGLAAAGTLGVAKGIGAAGNAFSKGARGLGGLMQRAGLKKSGAIVAGLGKHNASGVARAVQDWGGKKDIGLGVAKNMQNVWNKSSIPTRKTLNTISGGSFTARGAQAANISNSGYARMGAAALGAGLAGGAAYNAYRALTAKKNAERAATFRKEMNKAYAGTKYANGYKPSKRKRR